MDAHREPVILHVYDLCWGNHCSFCSRFGFGAYHTGVEVYGTEYGYGLYPPPNAKHPSDASGIFEIAPPGCEIFGTLTFKQSIEVGHTSLTQDEVSQVVKQLGESDFKGRHYHVLSRNCNHFSSKLTKLLCGKKAPGWTNRLARFATYVPFLERNVLTAGEGAELARRRRRHHHQNTAPPASDNHVVATQTPEENTNNTITEQPRTDGWLTGWL